MANTYTSLHYHIVFSTKLRQPWLSADVQTRIWKFMGGIARKNHIKALQIGGTEDHVHLVLGLPAKLAVSVAMQLIKGGSSKWIHEQFADLAGFEWQDGYGAFTISKSHLPDVIKYAANQADHHRKRSFQQEFRALLRKHEIDFDERFVWG